MNLERLFKAITVLFLLIAASRFKVKKIKHNNLLNIEFSRSNQSNSFHINYYIEKLYIYKKVERVTLSTPTGKKNIQ